MPDMMQHIYQEEIEEQSRMKNNVEDKLDDVINKITPKNITLAEIFNLKSIFDF